MEKKTGRIHWSIIIIICMVSFSYIPAAAETIIDNSDDRVSSTGLWYASGASGYYGADSVWSRDGATYTWSFIPEISGNYEVSMWWTTWPSRSDRVPVDIQYEGGTGRVYINQQVDGGTWNRLGKFRFKAGQIYKIKITADRKPASTCADAVRFIHVADNVLPTAVIESISPNPALPGEEIIFSGYGTDPDGLIAGYNWYSTLDGPLSDQPSFNAAKLSEGVHSIFFKVVDDAGAWSPEVHITVDVNNYQVQTTEQIFLAPGYASRDAMPFFNRALNEMGAKFENGVWTYLNTARNRNYLMYPVTTNEEFKNALRTEGAHIIYFGHSNYGLGQVFATPEEIKKGGINDIYHIDDDRIINLSSPWIHVNLKRMRTVQAYPFWWPVFKDGSSGIMPYDFGEPRGNPPHNYYITYQLPGDPAYYLMETIRGSAMERFPDSPAEPWYSPSGELPDADNPEHRKYYIRNTSSWRPSVELTGDWNESRTNPGFFAENYLATTSGQGNNQVKWLFNIPEAGAYIVSAWWPEGTASAPNVPYIIDHSSGSSTVLADQRVNGGKWNVLGSFSFKKGENSIAVTNASDVGEVAADAIRISHPGNPPDLLHGNFYAETRSGTAPLEITLIGNETGDVTKWLWDFGDGTTKEGRDDVLHVYKLPGSYTVSLTVTGPGGTVTKTKEAYINVGVSELPLQAEFRPPSAGLRTGKAPLNVRFRDLSTGSISSWSWDFGDGTKSTARHPSHTYEKPGNYTVTLTVTDAEGKTRTETKGNIIRVVVFEKKLDNVDYPKTHLKNKAILFRKELEVPKEEMRYARLLYSGCDSGHYYTDTFNRGIMFYATDSSSDGESAMTQYLKAYVAGKSDYEIWQIIQDVEPLYDYYDFRKPPAQQY
jgi:PKD repeat protein